MVNVTYHNRRVVKRLFWGKVDFGSKRPVTIAGVNGNRIEYSHHIELSISVEIRRGNKSAPNMGARVRDGPKHAVADSEPYRDPSRSYIGHNQIDVAIGVQVTYHHTARLAACWQIRP